MNKWRKLRRQNLGTIPTESSSNLQAPEIAPSRRTSKVNIRTKPLNFKVSEKFYWELKELALKKKKLMVEIIEKSLECYQQHCSKIDLSNKEKNKQEVVEKSVQNQLHPHSHQDFICNNCQKRFYNETAYSPTQHSGFLTITYCPNCKETIEIPETCSFREKDHQTNQCTSCNKPLFDKKKQLCRSHNRQVRNKFNEFTKDMSISSMAAWEMQWEQSSDWRYFWGLGEGSE